MIYKKEVSGLFIIFAPIYWLSNSCSCLGVWESDPPKLRSEWSHCGSKYRERSHQAALRLFNYNYSNILKHSHQPIITRLKHTGAKSGSSIKISQQAALRLYNYIYSKILKLSNQSIMIRLHTGAKSGSSNRKYGCLQQLTYCIILNSIIIWFLLSPSVTQWLPPLTVL